MRRLTAARNRLWHGAWALVLIALACLALPATPLLAHEDEAQFSVLIDPTRKLGVEDLHQYDFTPFTSTFGGGFTTSAYWVRIEFTGFDPPPLVLRFRPTTTDSILLFTPRPDGLWKRSDAGEIVVNSTDSTSSLGWYAFHIDPPPAERVYYARITTDSPGAITVSVVHDAVELRENARNAFWNAFVLAIQLLSIVLVMKRLRPWQSLSHFSFLGMSSVFATYLFIFNGYAATMLGIENGTLIEAVQEFFATLTVFSMIAFNYLLLREKGLPRPVRVAFLAVLALSALGILARLAGEGQLGIRTNIIAATLFTPLLAVAVATLQTEAKMWRTQLRIVYAVFIAAICINGALRFGFVDLDLLYRHNTEFLAIITSTLIFTLLWLENRNAEEGALRADVALARVSAELQVVTRYRRRQLALVREIDRVAQGVYDETQRALIDEAFAHDGPRAERSAEALRAVIDRCLFAHQAEEGHWRLTPARFSPAEALREMTATLAPPGRWHLNLTPFEIRSDRGLFDLAIRNLLSNALNYGADAPVLVNVRPDERDGARGAVVTITNQSLQADPFDESRVFDKFYRGPSAGHRSGTGLGLSITRDALAQVGGDVTIEARSHGSETQVIARLGVPDL